MLCGKPVSSSFIYAKDMPVGQVSRVFFADFTFTSGSFRAFVSPALQVIQFRYRPLADEIQVPVCPTLICRDRVVHCTEPPLATL